MTKIFKQIGIVYNRPGVVAIATSYNNELERLCGGVQQVDVCSVAEAINITKSLIVRLSRFREGYINFLEYVSREIIDDTLSAFSKTEEESYFSLPFGLKAEIYSQISQDHFYRSAKKEIELLESLINNYTILLEKFRAIGRSQNIS